MRNQSFAYEWPLSIACHQGTAGFFDSPVQDRVNRLKVRLIMEETYSHTLEELKGFIKESDRGCMLLLASRLDVLLEELHRSYTGLGASDWDFPILPV